MAKKNLAFLRTLETRADERLSNVELSGLLSLPLPSRAADHLGVIGWRTRLVQLGENDAQGTYPPPDFNLGVQGLKSWPVNADFNRGETNAPSDLAS